jgi:hypothetical protein
MLVATACCVLFVLPSFSSDRTEMFAARGGVHVRHQQLAYDGMYDTPPVTWYFGAQQSQNNLGYTWYI